MNSNVASGITKKMFLNSYRQCLRLAYQINSYNFRDHSLRKIKHDFRSK